LPENGSEDSLYVTNDLKRIYQWIDIFGYSYIKDLSNIVIQLTEGTFIKYTSPAAPPQNVDIYQIYKIGYDGRSYIVANGKKIYLDIALIIIYFSPADGSAWSDVYGDYIPPEPIIIPEGTAKVILEGLRALLDSNRDGFVDYAYDSGKLNGKTGSFYLDYSNFSNKPQLDSVVNINVGKNRDIYSIEVALSGITDASSSKIYNLILDEGEYAESFNTKDYVNIIGVHPQRSIISGAIYCESNTALKNLTIKGYNLDSIIIADTDEFIFDFILDNCTIIHEGFLDAQPIEGTLVQIKAREYQNFEIRNSRLIGFGADCVGIDYTNGDGLGYRSLKVENSNIQNVKNAIIVSSVVGSEEQNNDIFVLNNTLNSIFDPILIDNKNIFRLQAIRNEVSEDKPLFDVVPIKITRPPFGANTLPPLGDGSESDPYQIWYLEQLAYIDTNLAGNYKLMRDLDFNDDRFYIDASTNKPLWTTGYGWRPIGFDTESGSFVGVFDGNGKSIYNLYINRPEDDYVGLFSIVETDTFNVNVYDAYVFGGDNYTGILVGMSYASIEDVNVSGVVNGTGYVGGVVGIMVGSGSLKNISANTEVVGVRHVGGVVGNIYGDDVYEVLNVIVYSKVSGLGCVGGFAGALRGDGFLTHCYVNADISIVGEFSLYESDSVGGVVGDCRYILNDVVAYGSINGNAVQIGGICGTNRNSIKDCVAHVEITTQCVPSGGLVGVVYDESIGAFIKDCISYGDVSVATLLEGQATDCISALIGDSGVPVENCKAYGNILSAGGKTGGIAGASNALIKDCEYRGAISCEGENVGGITGLSNGGVNNCLVYAKITANGDYLGGIAGANYASEGIKMCKFYGSAISVGDSVGGIVGSDSSSNSLEDNYAFGIIQGVDFVGGIVGEFYGGEIIRCGSEADIVGEFNVGGIVGWTPTASLSIVYSGSDVLGIEYVGGIVGEMYNPLADALCWGNVAGSSLVGGICGYKDGNSQNLIFLGDTIAPGIIGANYDDEFPGVTILAYFLNGVVNEHGEKISVAQMKDALNFIGWDSNIWRIQNGKYPTLKII
jgi:hypothetical protein